ncbi:MAG: hypothetical protein SAJ37_02940 [Oscillatoria sp. PMC 1068.18]|nr:hypothetical protein [Oscillatoria sp. PMC 1076.18]MEC4987680.1 hypothetical protein [Oscillatoria sp. PMC 1068.18]
MTETALDQLCELGLRAIALDATAFEQIQTLPLNNLTALLFALIAGFSQAVGQAIVLFINRVKPLRFLLSLLIAALLYVFSYIFWALSTWIAAIILFAKYPSVVFIARTLGLAYAPLSFSFLVALPYLGIPISVILSVWSFLAFLTGLKALGLGIWQAFFCAALGWAVFQLSQRTIGRPITWLGNWLENSVAGVKLVTDLKAIEEVVETGWEKTQVSPGKN